MYHLKYVLLIHVKYFSQFVGWGYVPSTQVATSLAVVVETANSVAKTHSTLFGFKR